MNGNDTMEEIYRPILHATNVLRADGHSDDRIAEALLATGLDAVQQVHGPRDLSRRLWLMAHKFSQDADMLDDAIKASAGSAVN